MMQKFWTGADNHLNQPFQTKILIGAAAVREAEEKRKNSVHIRVHRGAPKKISATDAFSRKKTSSRRFLSDSGKCFGISSFIVASVQREDIWFCHERVILRSSYRLLSVFANFKAELRLRNIFGNYFYADLRIRAKLSMIFTSLTSVCYPNS